MTDAVGAELLDRRADVGGGAGLAGVDGEPQPEPVGGLAQDPELALGGGALDAGEPQRGDGRVVGGLDQRHGPLGVRDPEVADRVDDEADLGLGDLGEAVP